MSGREEPSSCEREENRGDGPVRVYRSSAPVGLDLSGSGFSGQMMVTEPVYFATRKGRTDIRADPLLRSRSSAARIFCTLLTLVYPQTQTLFSIYLFNY